MEITLYKPEFIAKVRREAAPKGCHPVQGFLEEQAFFEAYAADPMSVYQLIQVAGCGVYVSRAAAWLLMERHQSLN